MSAGITAGARGAAAGLGQASAGNARTLPRPRKPGLKSKSRGLETTARAAVERREASAPEADGSDRPWRAPRPWRGQVVTSVRVVRPIRFAPSGAPPPFFIWRRNIRGFRSCRKTRARSAPRERVCFSSPLAGEDRSRVARSGEGRACSSAAGPHPARRFAARRPLPQGERADGASFALDVYRPPRRQRRDKERLHHAHTLRLRFAHA